MIALVRQAQEAIATAAAALRALPDAQLVMLCIGGTERSSAEDLEAEAEPVKTPRRASGGRSARAPRTSKPSGTSAALLRDDPSVPVRDRILAFVLSAQGREVRGVDVAKAVDMSSPAARYHLLKLVGTGEIIANGEPGAYVYAAPRQTGAKKPRRPAKGSDEEEGDGSPA